MIKQNQARLIVFGACMCCFGSGYALATRFAKKRMDKMIRAHELEIVHTQAEWHSKGSENGWNEVAKWDARAIEHGLPIKKPFGQN